MIVNRFICAVLLVLAGACGSSSPAPLEADAEQQIVATNSFTAVFQDALAPGWRDFSWVSARNLSNPA
ncbi:MAG: hypothetical protein ACJ79G_19240, partial [Myxococcales bacterium]